MEAARPFSLLLATKPPHLDLIHFLLAAAERSVR